MNCVGLFAYGEMGKSALLALIKDYKLLWIILPFKNVQSDTEKSTELLAKKNRIPIHYSPTTDEIVQISQKNKPDIIIISSYNKILPEAILRITKCINVHLGDLPRYRGRANVNWAIINNRSEIGVTIHQVIPDLDAGNIYDQRLIPIQDTDTVKTMYDAINSYLLENISQVTKKILKGYIGKSQKGKATYCCTRLPEDGLIDWTKTSKEIDRFIRAQTKPYPGAFTYFDDRKMIVWDAQIPPKPKIFEGRIPGRIAAIIPDVGVEVLTGDSIMLLKNVSYKNKHANASEFIKSVKKTLGINWVKLYEKINEN